MVNRIYPLLFSFVFALAFFSFVPEAVAVTCSKNSGERLCMICNCFYEAGGEPDQGKLAVNIVVLARMNSDFFSENTVCSTIWKYKQFSWTNGVSSKSLSSSTAAYKACEKQTDTALTLFRPVRNPTHYYAATGANAIKPPAWSRARHFSVARKVGHHVFLNDSRESVIRIPKAYANFTSILTRATQ